LKGRAQINWPLPRPISESGFNGEIGELESKLSQRSENALSIFKVRPHKDVDVACVSGSAVKSQGIPADNKVFNLVLVQ